MLPASEKPVLKIPSKMKEALREAKIAMERHLKDEQKVVRPSNLWCDNLVIQVLLDHSTNFIIAILTRPDFFIIFFFWGGGGVLIKNK